jgi:hypothetical protein
MQPYRKPTRWQHHKKWIREAIQTGTPYYTAAAAHGCSRMAAWAVMKLPRVKQYMSSLHRMEANRAVQSRITIELSDSDAG